MRRFRCTRKLEIKGQVYDDGLRRIPNPEESLRILPGMLFMEYGEDALLVAEPPYIHLESMDGLWAEVHPDILKEFFEEVPW